MGRTAARSAYTSAGVLDPELRRTARFLPRGFALHRGLAVQRRLMRLAGAAGALASTEVVQLPGGPALRIIRPPDDGGPGPALVWFHGGGMVLGTASQEDGSCRRLAELAGVAVVSVDYRLAPEHPFPAQHDDGMQALRWVRAQDWVDPARVAVGGASAGGGLAAGIAQRAHDEGIELAAQLLKYPMLDDRTGRAGSGQERLMWSESDNRLAWGWYLGGADPHGAAPARRDDVSGLAPAWVGVGDLDLFHDESVAYAARLQEAGVPTTLHVVPGAFHAFDLTVPGAGVSWRFLASMCEHLRRNLIPGDRPATGRSTAPPEVLLGEHDREAPA